MLFPSLPAWPALYHLQIITPYMRNIAILDKSGPKGENILGSYEALKLTGTLG